jgi:hypothetical protein
MGDARGRDGGMREELAAGVRPVSFRGYRGPVCWPDPAVAKTDHAMEAWYHPSIA